MATKTTRGLTDVTYEDRLKELGMFPYKKSRPKGDVI